MASLLNIVIYILLHAIFVYYNIENLVPNVTAELYFVVQLLTARGIALGPQQDEETGKRLLIILL